MLRKIFTKATKRIKRIQKNPLTLKNLKTKRYSFKKITNLKKNLRYFSFIASKNQGNHSSPYKITNEKIIKFLRQQNMQYKTRPSGQITVKECPMCPKHHKNQSDNFFTLNFKPNNGAFICFRCGSHGSWYDFVRYMLGEEINFEGNESNNNHISQEKKFQNEYNLKNKTMMVVNECNSAYENLLEVEDFIEKIIQNDKEVLNFVENDRRLFSLAQTCHYLVGEQNNEQRYLNFETLKKFKIGLGEEAFKDEEGLMVRLPVVLFPFFRPSKNMKPEDLSHLQDENYGAVKVKLRAIGKEYKRFQRFKPSGGHFGVFGLNTMEEDSKAVVITEGEFDAMAVYQATKIPSISLPNGASHLPVQLLEHIEDLERIYLWMDNDAIGLQNIENFSNKIGVQRTYIVRPLDEKGSIKDANDALREGPELVREFIANAKTLPSDNIIKFENIRELVKDRLFNLHLNSGIKSTYFPWFNRVVKGFRRGELSIFTGPTGSGKTTFLSQLSLDFAKSGMPTLWCSFELKNEVLLSTMLSQYSGTNLNKNPQKFDYFADRFSEIPLYLQTYFGSTEVDKVLSLMEYAIYAYDIGHIVVDNLQFMLSGQGTGFQRYEIQDDVISKFRQLATNCNVHITLVIHPRKGEDDIDLSLNSVFGTAKSTQEADNVMILQHRQKYKVIDVKKNRFDGEIGKVSLWFNKDSKRFEQMGTREIEALISGTEIEEVLKRREANESEEEKEEGLKVSKLKEENGRVKELDREIESLFSEALVERKVKKEERKKKKGIILKIIGDEEPAPIQEEIVPEKDLVFSVKKTKSSKNELTFDTPQDEPTSDIFNQPSQVKRDIKKREINYSTKNTIEDLEDSTVEKKPDEDESIEEFKNSLFEPQYEEEGTISDTNFSDNIVNSLNSMDFKNVDTTKLQGFNSDSTVQKIESLYEEGDTILTYNDIVGDLVKDNNYSRNNFTGKKFHERNPVIKTRNRLDFSMNDVEED